MKSMTPTERIFLQLERPGYPVDIVDIFILESDETGPLPFQDVRRRFLNRAVTLPVFRWKVAHAPSGIGEDRWALAEHVDIDEHLRYCPVPQPGDLRTLLDLVLELTRDPLDRKKPLWDAWYIDGMADGSAVLVLRTHHAIIDGMGAMEMYASLFDPVPVAVDRTLDVPEQGSWDDPPLLDRVMREVPDRVTREAVASWRLAKAAGETVARGPVGRAVRRGWRRFTSPTGVLVSTSPGQRKSLLTRARRNLSDLSPLPKYVPSVTDHPPKVLFNRHVTNPDKSIAVVSLPFSHITEVRRRYPGVTVNDVILTVVTGSLRDYLISRDDLPDAPLRTTVPVNTRVGDEPRAEGNNFTTIWIDLPVHLEDRYERLQAVCESANRAKEAVGATQAQWDALANIGDLLLPSAVAAAMAFAGTPVFEYFPPTLNLTCSTLRGPGRPMYFAGRQIRNHYSRMIICPPVHLFINAMTYNGLIEFGVTSVHELVPDPEKIIDGLTRELDALRGVSS